MNSFIPSFSTKGQPVLGERYGCFPRLIQRPVVVVLAVSAKHGGEELNRILCDRLEVRRFWWGQPGDVSPKNGGKRHKVDETMLFVW